MYTAFKATVIGDTFSVTKLVETSARMYYLVVTDC
jgi:hypothetical protein